MNVVRTVRLGGASAVPTVVILASLLAVPSAVRSQGPRVSMGERLYAQQCAGCHGADLDGGVGPALRGRALLPQSRAKAPTAADLDIPGMDEDEAIVPRLSPGDALLFLGSTLQIGRAHV